MGGLQGPRMGFTDGWTPAEVVEDFNPERFNEWRVRDTGILMPGFFLNPFKHPSWVKDSARRSRKSSS